MTYTQPPTASPHEPSPRSAVEQRWLAPDVGLIAQMREQMQARAAHPARTLVLLPFAQLMPLARRMWAQAIPTGFAPRFETTVNWARSLGCAQTDAQDIRFERGRDLLTAQSLLEGVGLGSQRELLTARLLDNAYALAPLVAALEPAQRQAWAHGARAAVALGLEAPALALEATLARVALEWALVSGYTSDGLFEQLQVEPRAWDCLIVLHGFQPDPLSLSLLRLGGERAAAIRLVPDPGVHVAAAALGQVAWHVAQHAEDEAERAAACVLQHLNAGRAPVALVATDRVLTRRIRAMLDLARVTLRDETGWKLSTTRAAAQVLGCLRACRWDASTDSVLDWLKNAPALDLAALAMLEGQLRRAAVGQWRSVAGMSLGGEHHAGDAAPRLAVLQQVAAWREDLARSRPLAAWLRALRQTLQQSGVLEQLSRDAAGQRLIEVLRLGPHAPDEFDALAQAARRLSLAEFSAWVDEVLEASAFVPESLVAAQVVILPLSQLLARPFAAVVLPGCDEVRLNPSPEPAGHWSAAQRQALGLPKRDELTAATRAAWCHGLQAPHGDVLWRRQDDAGEPLLPSALVQTLLLDGRARPGADARVTRRLVAQPTRAPQASGARLPLARITASAYQDLRRCPYRFFALRQLGLQEADELESEVDKRDFGLWLHAVLKAFHDALQLAQPSDALGRRELLDRIAQTVSASQQLDAATFLPFSAAWPGVRDGYLSWLDTHLETGARYAQGESRHEQPLGEFTLYGTIDRIDRLSDASVLLLDYKTEPAALTAARVKQPLEDTQLAFYAALMPQDTLRAAYVNVGEKGGSKTYEQEQVVGVRDALMEGLLLDLTRIQAGAPLAALGQGSACDFCAARGLCRKDFWAI